MDLRLQRLGFSRRYGRISSSCARLIWIASLVSKLFSGAQCRNIPALIWVYNSSIRFGEAV
ncbi:unnamed protein product [Brassica rapa subsp. trilocularis]